MVQGGTNSSEFRIPDSELDGSVELRIPSPQPSRLTPVPSDKILFPRRMLYVEAVLYVMVAATAFGLGYLTGHGGWSATSKEDADVQNRVLVEGKVMLSNSSGTKHGDEGAVVIALPADKQPRKPLPIAGLQPSEARASGEATYVSLPNFGGAVARADSTGAFTLFVPSTGRYKILIISKKATREPNGPSEKTDLADLATYFDKPDELIRQYSYRWITEDLRHGGTPIDAQFTE